MSRLAGRRRCLAALTASTLPLFMPGLRAESRTELPRLTIAVGGKAGISHLPLTIAEQLGFFRAEGLEVDIADMAGWARAMQAVTGGNADICAGSFEQTVLLQSRGQYFPSLLLYGRALQLSVGVSARMWPGYRSPADLRGRKMGIPAPESTGHLVAVRALARAGVAPHEVSFIGVGSGAGALAALRSGQVDAICNAEPVMTALEQKGDVRIVADTRTLKGSVSLFGGNMPAACLYASAEFLQRNPRTCQALVSAMVRSLKWLQAATPRDILKAVPEAYMADEPALYLAAVGRVRETFSADGLMPADGPRTAIDVLTAFDGAMKDARLDPARLFVNDLALRAREHSLRA